MSLKDALFPRRYIPSIDDLPEGAPDPTLSIDMTESGVSSKESMLKLIRSNNFRNYQYTSFTPGSRIFFIEQKELPPLTGLSFSSVKIFNFLLEKVIPSELNIDRQHISVTGKLAKEDSPGGGPVLIMFLVADDLTAKMTFAVKKDARRHVKSIIFTLRRGIETPSVEVFANRTGKQIFTISFGHQPFVATSDENLRNVRIIDTQDNLQYELRGFKNSPYARPNVFAITDLNS